MAICSESTNALRIFDVIADITEGSENWIVTGLVISKSTLRTYESHKSGGNVISFELADATARIKVSAFLEKAEDVYRTVLTGEWYKITNGSIKAAHAVYNSTFHPYEIILTKASQIQLLVDPPSTEPFRFKFTKVRKLAMYPENTYVNIKGTIISVYSATKVIGKDNKEFVKKTVVLKDKRGDTVELQLWNDMIDIIQESDINRRLQILNGRVTAYQGIHVVSCTAADLTYLTN